MAELIDCLKTSEVSKLRFQKVEAEVYDSTKLKEGELNIVAQISVSEVKDSPDGDKHIATSTLIVIGAPKNASGEASAPSFKIEILVQALITWKDIPTKAEVNSQFCTQELCRPLYAIAVMEAQQLALKLGVSSIGVPLDLRTALANNPVEERRPAKKTSSPARRSAPKSS
jgi:hypothetical protein